MVVALYLFFIFQIGCPGFLTRDVFLLPFSSFKEREREREVAFFLLSLSSFSFFALFVFVYVLFVCVFSYSTVYYVTNSTAIRVHNDAVQYKDTTIWLSNEMDTDEEAPLKHLLYAVHAPSSK